MKASLDTKVFVITGASSGIGLEAAKQLALQGKRVVLAVRDVEKMERAMSAWADTLKVTEAPPPYTILHLDTSSLSSVRQFALGLHKQFGKQSIQTLICNAGIGGLKPYRPAPTTTDGIEYVFATNYLGHNLLTRLVLDNDLLNTAGSTADPRVVNVSSTVHRWAASDFEARARGDPGNGGYGLSKLAQVVSSFEFARRQRSRAAGGEATNRCPVKFISLHPGLVRSEIWRNDVQPKGVARPAVVQLVHRAALWVQNLVSLSPRDSAGVIVEAALGEKFSSTVSGSGAIYLVPGRFEALGLWWRVFGVRSVEPSRHASDASVGQELWQLSEKLAPLK